MVGEVQLQQLLKKDDKIQIYNLDLPENIFDLDKSTEFGISLMSLNEDVRREYEPNSHSYLERITYLKDLHDNGFKTFINIYIRPSIQLSNKDLRQLLKRVSFVDKIIIEKPSYDINITTFNRYIDVIVDYCNENYLRYHVID